MEGQQPDFKWFGEGFDGFPKYLPQDCVEYSLYIIDPKLKDSEVRSELLQIQIAAKIFTKNLLQGFIWQRQGFKLDLVQDRGLIFLRGRTNHGDSVEDEWLIVYILVELGKKFPKVWSRIIDTDGEFLLIEAANTLPQWLNPEVAEFRVSADENYFYRIQHFIDKIQLWLHEGNLLIIPIQDALETAIGKRTLPKAITLEDAFSFLQENRPKLIHSPMIEAEAFYRLQKYPKQIENSMHHSLTTIPRKLAFILHNKAIYISPAVEAFYLRDPVSLRLLKSDDINKQIFPPNDLVTVSVKYTKVGFAQVKSQQFDAPSPWAKIFSTETDVGNFARLEMGMKITCGFEMLLSDPNNIDSPAVREMKLLLEDLEAGDDRLPSNFELSERGHRDDDEIWLDIDFVDFDKELRGKGTIAASNEGQGFGDKSAQENLRKMVTRFEAFLNDDNAGVDGAECFDEMDHDDENSDSVSNDDDDDDDDDNDTNSGSEDKGVSFDEYQFAKMMREMMGISADTAINVDPKPNIRTDTDTRHSDGTDNHSNEGDDGIKLRQDMQAMEKELQDAGALPKHLKPSPDKATRQMQSTHGHISPSSSTADESDTDDVDIDYNLAKNLLESFKSQNGAAGPGGNLMGMMGMRLPRDGEDTR